MAQIRFNNLAILFITIICSIHLANTEFCRLPTRLEFVFLVDNSGPYPVKKIKDTVTIIGDLSKKYNGSKFGVSLFSDFECEAWTAKDLCKTKYNWHHKDPHACYTFYEKLTADVAKIKKSLNGDIKIKASNSTEAGINGLVMTAAENKMGWTRGRNHAGLVRLIVVVTNDGSNEGGPLHGTHDGKIRKPVKGDGTDKCETMMNAKAEDVNRVLGKDRIGVYVLVQAKKESIWNNWRDKLKKLKDVKHRMQSWDDEKKVILGKIKDFIDELAKDVEKVDCDLCAMLI